MSGSTLLGDGVFSVTGAGADVWGTADQFEFAYRQVSGDATIVAQLMSIEHVNNWTKAGLMIRESLSAGSKHASVFGTPSNGIGFQRRTSTGGLSDHTSGGWGTAPVWLKLERRSAEITAYRSDDGWTWTTIGTSTISMGETVYVGLAVTSHNVSVRATATFSSVLVDSVMPAGWTSQDIGAPAMAGVAGVSDGTYTIDGAGADIWGTSDQFRYAYQQMSGDVDVVTRVASLQAMHSWTKAGVMIRESLDASAAHASLFATGANGVAFQYRPSAGGASASTSGGGGQTPVWLKLSRRGSTITAYRSDDSVSWTTIGEETLSLPTSFYVGLAVTSHDVSRLATATFDNVSMVTAEAPGDPPPADGELPAGWTSDDIGAPAVAGQAGLSSGTYTIDGAGADIWGTSDQFRYAYRQMSGDVDVVTRVASLQAMHSWTKAGVMIRQSLSASAAHASLFISGANGVAFQRRPSAGGTSLHTSGGGGEAPVWLKLSRRGSTITAYRSADNVSWTTIGQQTLSLPTSFYVGLAVVSHDVSQLARATFDNVTIGTAGTPGNQSPDVSLIAPQSGATFSAPASIALAASASDPDGSIARVDFYAGSTLVGTDTSSPFAVSWNNVPAGTYALTAVARDNAGATTVSGARDISVLDPNAPNVAVFTASSNHDTAVDRYVLDIFSAGADPSVSNPVAMQDLGKPPVTNGECAVDIAATIAALPSGTYIATVTAIGSGGSARSAPSATFAR